MAPIEPSLVVKDGRSKLEVILLNDRMNLGNRNQSQVHALVEHRGIKEIIFFFLMAPLSEIFKRLKVSERECTHN